MEEKKEFSRSEVATVKTLAKGLIPIEKERKRLITKLAKVRADINIREEELSNEEEHIRNVIKEFTKGYTLEEVLGETPTLVEEPEGEINDSAVAETKEVDNKTVITF